MAKIFSLMYMGDWVSLYLAFLYTMDPGDAREGKTESERDEK